MLDIQCRISGGIVADMSPDLSFGICHICPVQCRVTCAKCTAFHGNVHLRNLIALRIVEASIDTLRHRAILHMQYCAIHGRYSIQSVPRRCLKPRDIQLQPAIRAQAASSIHIGRGLTVLHRNHCLTANVHLTSIESAKAHDPVHPDPCNVDRNIFLYGCTIAKSITICA